MLLTEKKKVYSTVTRKAEPFSLLLFFFFDFLDVASSLSSLSSRFFFFFFSFFFFFFFVSFSSSLLSTSLSSSLFSPRVSALSRCRKTFLLRYRRLWAKELLRRLSTDKPVLSFQLYNVSVLVNAVQSHS
jgi:hypothetical protein